MKVSYFLIIAAVGFLFMVDARGNAGAIASAIIFCGLLGAGTFLLINGY